MKKPERRNGQGQLLGPARPDKYMQWRLARDKAIANPRRLKMCKNTRDEPGSGDNSSPGDI